MIENSKSMVDVADRLAELYARPFGGKKTGRYRIAAKLVRELASRRRLYEDDVKELTREMLERGFVLVDMETFFVVLSANTFVNYRRANEDSIA
jgi:hypothetical protein